MTRENPDAVTLPQTTTTRRKAAQCGKCGSTDIWRVNERKGFIAAIMRLRGWKPFQCRACRDIFYRPSRRKTDIADQTTPVR